MPLHPFASNAGTTHHGSWANLGLREFLHSLRAKNGYCIFICWKEKKIKGIIFCDTWKLYDNQISVSVNKFYWNTALYFLVYWLPVAAFAP